MVRNKKISLQMLTCLYFLIQKDHSVKIEGPQYHFMKNKDQSNTKIFQ